MCAAFFLSFLLNGGEKPNGYFFFPCLWAIFVIKIFDSFSVICVVCSEMSSGYFYIFCFWAICDWDERSTPVLL